MDQKLSSAGGKSLLFPRGLGLGLSIARQAADLLNAKLWAESKVGEGTAFHIELPK